MLFSFFFATTSLLAQSLDLKLALSKNETVGYALTSEVEIVQRINDVENITKMLVKNTASLQVKSIRKGSYYLEANYEALSLDLDLTQTSISINSESTDDNDIFSSILKKLINQPFEVVLSETGEITKITGMENMFDAAFQDFTNLPQAKVDQVKGQLTKAFGKESFKGNFQSFVSIFPHQVIDKDASWKRKTTFDDGMTAAIDATYQLKSINSENAELMANADIESLDKDSYYELNGMSFKYDLTGFSTSEITIDRATGWVIQATVNQEIEGDSFLQPSTALPNGLTIPIKISNRMEIKGR